MENKVSVAVASADNNWEFSVERNLRIRRWHAYRIAVDCMEEWWWHPSSRPVANIVTHLATGNGFTATTEEPAIVQEGMILRVRPGWHFEMTDAFTLGARPATPSMVGTWFFKSMIHGYTTHVATIRHFSEADYQRNLALGLEEGWNNAADRLVRLCEEGIGAIKWHRMRN